MTGKTYTSFRTQEKKTRPFRMIKIGLTRDREELYARINQRVDIMMEQGLLDEVKQEVLLPFLVFEAIVTLGWLGDRGRLNSGEA